MFEINIDMHEIEQPQKKRRAPYGSGKGAGSDDMRSFVQKFREHLKDAGCPHDDKDLWRLLRRVRILPLDYASPGSAPKSSPRSVQFAPCIRTKRRRWRVSGHT
jgi:hypothetical protein